MTSASLWPTPPVTDSSHNGKRSDADVGGSEDDDRPVLQRISNLIKVGRQKSTLIDDGQGEEFSYQHDGGSTRPSLRYQRTEVGVCCDDDRPVIAGIREEFPIASAATEGLTNMLRRMPFSGQKLT
jgi:hypothetical protein